MYGRATSMPKCCTCTDEEPGLKPGDNIHSKKVFENGVKAYRLGCDEVHVLDFLSDSFAIWSVFRKDGRLIVQKVSSRKEFDEQWEKCT